MTKAVTSTLRLTDSEGAFGTAGFLVRPAHGYKIVSGLRPLDSQASNGAGGESGTRWLIPEGDGWERYPVTVRLALADSFKKLARSPSEDSILAFANKWGWLGEPVPLVREGQHEVVPRSADSGLVEGERIGYWEYELLAFRERDEVLRAVDVVRHADAHTRRPLEEARSVLASRIEWIDGGVRYRGRQDTPYPTTRWIIWPPGDRPDDLVERFQPPGRYRPGDIVGPARFQMFREVNEIIREHVELGVPAFVERPVIRSFPKTLIGAIYLRYVIDGLGVDADERQCRNCGDYFTHGNAKRRYCSDECRAAFGYRDRKSRRRST